jgi:hypothetical protein
VRTIEKEMRRDRGHVGQRQPSTSQAEKRHSTSRAVASIGYGPDASIGDSRRGAARDIDDRRSTGLSSLVEVLARRGRC